MSMVVLFVQALLIPISQNTLVLFNKICPSEIVFPAQSEKIEFLTGWPHLTLDDLVSYISEIYMENQVEWHLAHLNLRKLNFWPDDLFRPWMTLYEGKSYISENYMKNWVEWHLAHLNLKKLIFDLSWPLPTLDDFVCWKIIHNWNLYEKSSWMIPCTTQYDKVDFWPFLTFNQHFWPLEICIRSLNY